MAVSTNQKPTIYRNLYENTAWTSAGDFTADQQYVTSSQKI